MIDATERFEKIQEAIKARDRFLPEHPKLIPFQKDIERRLRGAGGIENRMTILGSKMEEKLLQLSKTCLEARRTWASNR